MSSIVHIREQMNAFERGRLEIQHLKQSIRMGFWERDQEAQARYSRTGNGTPALLATRVSSPCVDI